MFLSRCSRWKAKFYSKKCPGSLGERGRLYFGKANVQSFCFVWGDSAVWAWACQQKGSKTQSFHETSEQSYCQLWYRHVKSSISCSGKGWIKQSTLWTPSQGGPCPKEHSIYMGEEGEARGNDQEKDNFYIPNSRLSLSNTFAEFMSPQKLHFLHAPKHNSAFWYFTAWGSSVCSLWMGEETNLKICWFYIIRIFCWFYITSNILGIFSFCFIWELAPWSLTCVCYQYFPRKLLNRHKIESSANRK